MEENKLQTLQTAPDAKTRERYGKFAGYLSIGFNVLLAAGKIAAGAVSGVLSVLADGLNNLTDCGSNAVSVIGFKMAGKPADKEHPFGHQRAEYVASMVISLIILVVAVELAISSVEKILSPETGEFSVLTLVILIVSVLVKLGMFVFNRRLGRKISSETLKATATDSISDAIATTAVLVSLLISHYSKIDLDGYMGVLVALFIAFAGVSILKDTISRLLGKAPDADVVKKIEERILAFNGVHGLHDLTVHNYGECKMYATVHVEVDSHMPIMAAHDLADNIEHEFTEHTDILLTVHIDPLVFDDPKINLYRGEIERIVRDIDGRFRVHDFRMVGGETHANLVFDLAVPFDNKLSEETIMQTVKDRISLLGENLGVVMTLERQNINE